METRRAIVEGFAALPAGAVVWKAGLADLLGRSEKTVERWVARGELPAPMRLGGRCAWLVGSIRDHWAHMQAAAIAEQERECRRIAALGA